MFTGIVTDIGIVLAREDQGVAKFRVETRLPMTALELGASVACSGACMTVIAAGSDDAANWFEFEATVESLALTKLGGTHTGDRLNLEAALKTGDALGGHMMTGHVDGPGELISAEDTGAGRMLTFRAPDSLAGFIAAKGSVAIDGVSLTVNSVADTGAGCHFTVMIIPHTWTHTTLGDLAPGDAVNLEIDLLARYVARLLDSRQLTS